MKKLPQPIPYQGSKRNIAPQILNYFPLNLHTLMEPFAGSAAVSVAAAFYQKAERFHLNDLNQPLMALLEVMINNPKEMAESYEQLWNEQLDREKEYYFMIRDEFNRTHRPDHFLYLLARCVKAAVRYNQDGEFNQSPDNRRKGRRPQSMSQEIYHLSNLLKRRTTITSYDYKDVLDVITQKDLLYLDPPYQGTSSRKDRRYYSGVDVSDLIQFLEALNQRQIMFILSYDGRSGTKTYGQRLPPHLNLHHLEIDAGRSTQSTLLGGKAVTYESLYLSPALTERLPRHVLATQNITHKHPYQLAMPLELGVV